MKQSKRKEPKQRNTKRLGLKENDEKAKTTKYLAHVSSVFLDQFKSTKIIAIFL